MKIKKNDTVIMLSGVDKGKKGKVLRTVPKSGRLIVEGIHMVSRHTKPKKQGEPGGIIKQEAAFDVSKAMLICPKCSKPTRIGIKFLEDKSRVRQCKKCSETF